MLYLKIIFGLTEKFVSIIKKLKVFLIEHYFWLFDLTRNSIFCKLTLKQYLKLFNDMQMQFYSTECARAKVSRFTCGKRKKTSTKRLSTSSYVVIQRYCCFTSGGACRRISKAYFALFVFFYQQTKKCFILTKLSYKAFLIWCHCFVFR